MLVRPSALARQRGFGSVSSGTDPFPWFTAFDMNLFPPHLAAGSYGPQQPVLPPAVPNITGTGTAGTPTQLRDALFANNTRVTMTDDIADLVATSTAFNNGEIVVPSGALLLRPTIGNFTNLLIRGDTALGAAHGGGQMHHLRADSVTYTGLVVGGLNISGAFNQPALALGPAAGANRTAIVNCRIRAGGFAIGNTSADITLAGCSIITGEDTDAQNSPTDEEAYGYRNYRETLGNILAVYCEFRSNPARSISSHARWRNHPNPGLNYIFGYGNRFVERVEHHIFNVNAEEGSGTGVARATWFLYTEVISDGTGTNPGADTPKMYGSDQERVIVDHVVFKSSGFTNSSHISLSGTVATTKTNLDFQSLPGSDPAYGAALTGLAAPPSGVTPGCGDPSGINIAP